MAEGPRGGYRRVRSKGELHRWTPVAAAGTVRPGDAKKSQEKAYDRASMATVLRLFVMDREGNPRRLARASFGALVEGVTPVPEGAATPFLCACDRRREWGRDATMGSDRLGDAAEG
jgi:hypothetical protein